MRLESASSINNQRRRRSMRFLLVAAVAVSLLPGATAASRIRSIDGRRRELNDQNQRNSNNNNINNDDDEIENNKQNDASTAEAQGNGQWKQNQNNQNDETADTGETEKTDETNQWTNNNGKGTNDNDNWTDSNGNWANNNGNWEQQQQLQQTDNDNNNGDKNQWNANDMNFAENQDEVTVAAESDDETVDAFLHSNETKWHDIAYDDDTVKGWQQMKAASDADADAVPIDSPKHTSDVPSSMPSHMPVAKPTVKPTWRRKTDSPTGMTASPTGSIPKTGAPTAVPTEEPTTAISNGNQFLSFGGNTGWEGANEQQQQQQSTGGGGGGGGFSISSNFQSPPTQSQFIMTTSTTPLPTLAPTSAPVQQQSVDSSFFGFLSPPTYSEQGTTEQPASSAEPAATIPDTSDETVDFAPSGGDSSSFFQDVTTTSASSELNETTSNATVPTYWNPTSTSDFSEEGTTNENYPPANGDSLAQREPDYMGAASYPPAAEYAPGNGYSDPGNIEDATHLFQTSEHDIDSDHMPEVTYPDPNSAGVTEPEMLNMTDASSMNSTGGDYGYQAEGAEDSAGQPASSTILPGSASYPDSAISSDSADMPDWYPYPPEGSQGSVPRGSSKGSKGIKGGKGGGARAHNEAALKCMEEQKAAKRGSKGDDMLKKCPELRSSNHGARKKITVPKPEYPPPGYPQHPAAPTYFHSVFTYPPHTSIPVSTPPVVTIPSTAPVPTIGGSTLPPIAMAPSSAPVQPMDESTLPAPSFVPAQMDSRVPTATVDSLAPISSPGSVSPGTSESPTTSTVPPTISAPTPDMTTLRPSITALSPTIASQPSATTTNPGITELPTRVSIAEPSVGPPIIPSTTAETGSPSTSISSPTAAAATTAAPSVSGGTAFTIVPTALIAVAPSASETSAPTQLASVTQISETWVRARSVSVEAQGSIDLATAQEEVFNQTVNVMRPFFQAFFDENLESFQLGLTFLESETVLMPVGDTGSEAVVQSYFVADVSFLISSADMDVLIQFDRKKATDLVESFYQGDPREALLKLLYGKGIELDSLEVFTGDLSQADDESDPTGTAAPTMPPTRDPELSSEKPETTVTNSTNAALYAGIVSGGVILVAIGAVIYSTRKGDRNIFKDAIESVSDSLYNDSIGGPPGGKFLPMLSPRANGTVRTGKSSTTSCDSRSRIKPAAITLRGKRAPQESPGSVSTLGSTRYHAGSKGRSPPIDEEMAEHHDHLHRMENGPDLVASRVLTYNDGEIQGLVTNYPEFDIYHPTNPYADSAWSVDGLTLEDENDSRTERPRRWQDESSETGISGLPDHLSSSNGSAKS